MSRKKTKEIDPVELKKKIQSEMEAARTQLNQEINTVAQLINTKLIGKDLSA